MTSEERGDPRDGPPSVYPGPRRTGESRAAGLDGELEYAIWLSGQHKSQHTNYLRTESPPDPAAPLLPGEDPAGSLPAESRDGPGESRAQRPDGLDSETTVEGPGQLQPRAPTRRP